MLSPEHEVTISSKHQPYLTILHTTINDGETVTWAVIKKAYKERARIVHPDKGGTEDSFRELNTAFQKLEHLIEYGTELKFNALAEMSSSLVEMLNELRAHRDRMHEETRNILRDHFDRMGEELKRGVDELRSTLHTEFSEIPRGARDDGMLLHKLDVTSQRLDEVLNLVRDSDDKMAANTKHLHAIIQAHDDEFNFNIDLSFYFGCYTVFLGSVVSAIGGKHQPQNARSIGTFVFGAGLIATGSYLIANSLFKKDKPTPADEEAITHLI